MAYLTASDIKSNFTKNMDLTEYLEEADQEIEDICEKKGVRDTADISIPIHYKLKQYGIKYLKMRVAQDSIGTVNQDVSLDVYREQYDMYRTEIKELYNHITYQMITGTVDSMGARVAVFNIYRS